jgi:hypothetical protein
MLLRASGAIDGEQLDLRALTGAAPADTCRVRHADVLLAFTDAVVGSDDDALIAARATLLDAMGPAALVDAAAVASNFERMVRVADATGIPLDAPLLVLSAPLRRDLHLDRFAAAANTRALGTAARLLGHAIQPLTFVALRLFGWLRGAR